MPSKKKHYFHLWLNDDNFDYLNALPEKVNKSAVVNQALRYFANLSDYSKSTSGIDITANVANTTTPAYDGATISASVRSISEGYLRAKQDSVGYSDINPRYPTPDSNITVAKVAPSTILCPNGHLWMNGTIRCVNRKCPYGRIV